MYEMTHGFPPFFDGSAVRMLDMIQNIQVQIRNEALSDGCKDIISKLLDKDPKIRLGSKGDIKEI